MSRQGKSLFQQAHEWSDELAEKNLCDLLKDGQSRYSDDYLVGEGGMKKVFGSQDRKTGRLIARAELRDPKNDEHLYKFIREARITASLQHPNIIPIYDVDLNEEGEPYFTMKFIEGGNLALILSKLKEQNADYQQRFQLKDLLEIFKRLCEAVAYAHERGVLHMDLKPENIQVSPSREVLLCDWGMAVVLESQCEDEELLQLAPQPEEWNKSTLDGFIKGTPGYMAPERLKSSQDRKGSWTDVYSLGALLYEILSLERLHQGELKEVIQKTLDGEIISPRQVNANIPIALESICLKAIATKVSERYQKVDDLLADLEAFAGGFAPQAEEASFVKQFQLLVKRHKTASILISSFLSGMLLLSLFYNIQLRKRETQAQESRIVAEEKTKALDKERSRRILLGKEAAPRYLEKALTAHENYRLDESLWLSELVLELDDTLLAAWGHKGLCHMMRQEFKEAAECYRRYPEYPYVLDLCERYARIKNDREELTTNELVVLLKELSTKNHYLFDRMLHTILYSKISLDQRIMLSSAITPVLNKRITVAKFNYNPHTKELDLSGNKELRNIRMLQNFPARKLNLSFCPIKSIEHLKDIPLQDLDLNSTQVSNLSPLKGKTLRRLNLANTKVTDLTALINCSLVELDIRDCKVDSLKVLKEFQYLRLLTISTGQFSAQQLAALPQELKVMIK